MSWIGKSDQFCCFLAVLVYPSFVCFKSTLNKTTRVLDVVLGYWVKNDNLQPLLVYCSLIVTHSGSYHKCTKVQNTAYSCNIWCYWWIVFQNAGHCIFLQDAYTQAGSIVNILRAGPEPLQSHFATGYGMVLKLLNKRKLEYARNFVQRSFYNYLGTTLQTLSLTFTRNILVTFNHC